VKRGDVVIAISTGDYGKPRPAVIVQSDLFNETHASIIVCLMTSELHNAPLFRINVQPNKENGLTSLSQIMIDKVVAIKRERISQVIGTLDDATLLTVNRSLALFMGIA
jgi:mRNA interferase MazF